jgi:hypothetical protein
VYSIHINAHRKKMRALYDAVGEGGQLQQYEFVNWYADDLSGERAKAYLRIAAANSA